MMIMLAGLSLAFGGSPQVTILITLGSSLASTPLVTEPVLESDYGTTLLLYFGLFDQGSTIGLLLATISVVHPWLRYNRLQLLGCLTSLAPFAISCTLPASTATTGDLEKTYSLYHWSVPRNTRAIQENYAENGGVILFAEYVHTHAMSNRGLYSMALGEKVVLDLVENIAITKNVARKLRYIDDRLSRSEFQVRVQSGSSASAGRYRDIVDPGQRLQTLLKEVQRTENWSSATEKKAFAAEFRATHQPIARLGLPGTSVTELPSDTDANRVTTGMYFEVWNKTLLSTLLLFAKTDSLIGQQTDAPSYERVGFFPAYERLSDFGEEEPNPKPLFHLPLVEFQGGPPMPLVSREASAEGALLSPLGSLFPEREGQGDSSRSAEMQPVAPIRAGSLQAAEIQKLFARSSVPLRLDSWQIEMELPKSGLRQQVITVRQIHVLDFLASKVIEKLSQRPCTTTE